MRKEINTAMIKALAIDMDGTTLLPDASMGARTIECLKKLRARGMQIIFCTGRAIESSRPFFNAIGADGPMVFYNGAEVADVPEAAIISSNLLGLDVVDYGIDLARSMDVHIQLFFPSQNHPKTLFIERQRPESEMYQRYTSLTPVVLDLKTAIASPELKGIVKMMFIADPAILNNVREKMVNHFGSRIYITQSFATFLEVLKAGVSKGEGLKTVMQCRGLKPAEVIAFGDEENDLPMFSIAGFSAAPSSAREKVRGAADFVFGPNSEEGLAAFLEKIFSLT